LRQKKSWHIKKFLTTGLELSGSWEKHAAWESAENNAARSEAPGCVAARLKARPVWAD
jgi:hypothetical protein